MKRIRMLLAAGALLFAFHALAQEADLAGKWAATFSDSISTGTAQLLLSRKEDGQVTGLVYMNGTNIGRMSGQLERNTFCFTLVQTLEGCPGTFSGQITLAGGTGSGRYVGTDCSGEHKNGVLSIVRLTAEVPRTAPSSARSDANFPHCLVSDPETSYVSWLCDEAGRIRPSRTEIYYIRTNRAGERTPMLIWAGSREDWRQKKATVIAEHQRNFSNCSVYVNVSHVTSKGEVRWDWWTRPMRKWWKKDGPKKFPGFCYARQPWEADYVIVWTDAEYSVSYSFTLPRPKSFYYSGNLSGYAGGEYVYGNYSGHVYTTEDKTYSGSRSEWKVNAVVYPVEPNTRVVYESNHTGRTIWSKPDKDALVDSLKFIRRLVSNK